MSKKFYAYKEGSRGNWTTDLGANTPSNDDLKLGAILRMADTLESIDKFIRPFPGCQMARDIHKIATKGIKIELSIKWPWQNKRRKKGLLHKFMNRIKRGNK